MNKRLYPLTLTLAFLLGACGSSTPIYEKGTAKTLKGTGTIFNEVLGFNTKDASIFEEDGVRYVFYETNETKNGEKVFAARKGELKNDEWVYGKKHIILRGDSESWDINIYKPAVIKGEFKLGSVTYEYLMTYNGNDNTNDTNNHIGVAVTNNLLGEWTKIGDSPILTNPEIHEASYGFGGTSLISFDQKGKGYLFYTVGETDVTFTAAKAYDFSNLEDIKVEEGYSSLPVEGLHDRADINMITNASFALNRDKTQLLMVRDRLPASGNKPGQTTEVEVSKSDIAILGDLSKTWTNIGFVAGADTIDAEDPESMGWDQIYSGDFVTDPYGMVLSASELEILYSTFDEESEDVNYSSTLALHTVAY